MPDGLGILIVSKSKTGTRQQSTYYVSWNSGGEKLIVLPISIVSLYVVRFFYALNAHILQHSKYSSGKPTLSSQGLHILTKRMCREEGGWKNPSVKRNFQNSGKLLVLQTVLRLSNVKLESMKTNLALFGYSDLQFVIDQNWCNSLLLPRWSPIWAL